MPVVVDKNSELGRQITARNLGRQYDFLDTAFRVWQAGHRLEVGKRLVCELNFYAAHFLSETPGLYREVEVEINGSQHQPPPWRQVEKLMSDFFPRLDAMCGRGDPIGAASYALWRLNWIHPFSEGNGRTARALCYFVLCHELKMWLPGTPIIPEQIRATHQEYCANLSLADGRAQPDGTTHMPELSAYLNRLLTAQLQ